MLHIFTCLACVYNNLVMYNNAYYWFTDISERIFILELNIRSDATPNKKPNRSVIRLTDTLISERMS